MRLVRSISLRRKFLPVTLVCHRTLALLLQNYDSVKANYLVCGFNNGFRIGFQGDMHFRASPNLKSASEFPGIVVEKLQKKFLKVE